MRAGWSCLLVLASCSFIDDFDRFRIASAGDAGPDVGEPDGARDATVGEAETDAAGDGADAGARNAEAGAGDARVDPAADRRDASSPPDANVPAGCGTTGRDAILSCYPDRDGDGFPDLTQPATLACRCASDALAVSNPSAAQSDCWDDPDSRGADVFPGQARYFDRGYGPAEDRYDFDCSGAVSPERGVYANDCAGLLGVACADRAGFGAPTACGVRATYVTCTADSLLACQARTDQRTQACH